MLTLQFLKRRKQQAPYQLSLFDLSEFTLSSFDKIFHSQYSYSRYRDLNGETLFKALRMQSRRILRGIGKELDPNYNVWLMPTDDELEIEIIRRRPDYWPSDNFLISPEITEEEKLQYEQETIAIMERRENRFTVIDTCTPQELYPTLKKYMDMSNIFYTKHNHSIPGKIYGPLPKINQLSLQLTQS